MTGIMPQAARDNKYEGWPTKEDVLTQLGISERTLYRLVERKEIEQQHVRVPGRKPVNVYNPSDVERMAKQTLEAQPAVFPAGKGPAFIPSPAPRSLAPVPAKGGPEQLFRALLEATKQQATGIPADRKLMLSVRECVEYSGLMKKTVREAIADGSLKSIRQGRSVRVSRKELERFVGKVAKDD